MKIPLDIIVYRLVRHFLRATSMRRAALKVNTGIIIFLIVEMVVEDRIHLCFSSMTMSGILPKK